MLGFFSFFLIKAGFFFKKVSSSDFIAALLKQYSKNKKGNLFKFLGFQTSSLFIALKNTLFSPPLKTVVYASLTKYRCKVTKFHITNKFK